MVKNPFPSVEVLQTYGTEQIVTKVIFPDGFDLMDSKRMQSQLLLGWCRKRATIHTASIGDRLLGRAVDCGRGAIAIGIPTLRILFDLSPKIFAIGPNSSAPILKGAIDRRRESICTRQPS